MTFDDTVDLLSQIAVYAGIAAIVLFVVLFILTAIVRAKKGKPDSTKTGG